MPGAPNQPKIPSHLESEIHQRHQAGHQDPQIAAWLQAEHQIPATRVDVWRARHRYVNRVLKSTSPQVIPGEGPLSAGVEEEIPLADEDLLRYVKRDLGRRYALAKDKDERLATAAVLAKVAAVLRLVKRDRIEAERDGRGEGQRVKGYAIVSPDDWPN